MYPSPTSAAGYVLQTQYDQYPPQQQPQYPSPQYSQHEYSERKVFMLGRTWLEKKQTIRRSSAFGHLSGWSVRSFIVKSGDDLRKEVVAMQLIEFFRNIFLSEGLDISLRPYRILSTGHMSGLVEFLEGCRSIDSIKKSCTSAATIKDYFEFCFGATYSPIFANAVQNFVKSLVGYSLVTYVLQVKDRHNANIMLDTDGHVVHIDYGFILGDSPGFNINFENAPFKLTREYIEVLGGLDSVAFKTFEDLFVRGFFALQKHVDAICTIVQVSCHLRVYDVG
jgi:phosphatidylinositol 4-kinase